MNSNVLMKKVQVIYEVHNNWFSILRTLHKDLKHRGNRRTHTWKKVFKIIKHHNILS